MGDEFSAENFAAITEFRKHLQTCEAKGWEHFDDVLFKIAAGGLALSITFLGVKKDIIPASMVWIYGAWICWSLTLLTVMLSVDSGQAGLRSQIDRLDDQTYYKVTYPQGNWGRWTYALNRLGMAVGCLGLVFLLVFAVENISGGEKTAGPQSPHIGPQPTAGAQRSTGEQAVAPIPKP